MRILALSSFFYYYLLVGPTSISVAGFVVAPPTCPTTRNQSSATTSPCCLKALSTPEEYAKILTDYMARAHQEKLKALDVLEKKKNAEIAALEQQLATVVKNDSLSLPPSSSSVSSSSLVTSSGTAAGTMEEIEALTQKVNMYQKFIADYVIKAQAEKEKAVKEAEIAFEKKYQEKLNAFLLNSAGNDSTLEDGSSGVSSLYRERNAKIALAAKAGTSRWGNEELKRVGATVLPPTKMMSWTTATVDKSATADSVVSPPQEVVDADHGMRADGGVGGPTLADRVMKGANVDNSGATPSSSLYEKRNVNIARAVSGGVSTRWGTKEVTKVMDIPSNALAASTSSPTSSSSSSVSNTENVLAQVEAANHGMRADGGVGGPTLAERVNLGATLLKGKE
jgi:hypothetical protein